MSKLLKEISKNTSIAMQFVKEKAGTSAKASNPQFDSAVEKFDLLTKQFETLVRDTRTIIMCAKVAAKTAVDIGKYSTKAAESNLNESTQAVVKEINNFAEKNESMMKDNLIALAKANVDDKLVEVQNQLNRLSEVRSACRKDQLLVGSLRDDIERYSKRTDKSQKLASARIEYETANEKLNRETYEFITGVEAIWSSRFLYIEGTIQEFVGICYTYTQFVYGNEQIMTKSIPPPQMHAYPPQGYPQQGYPQQAYQPQGYPAPGYPQVPTYAPPPVYPK